MFSNEFSLENSRTATNEVTGIVFQLPEKRPSTASLRHLVHESNERVVLTEWRASQLFPTSAKFSNAQYSKKRISRERPP